jgi:formate hydrogenlyase transcriptional activator
VHEENLEWKASALKRYEDQLELLLKIARAIHNTLDLSKVFRALVDSLRPLVQFDRASILVVSDDQQTLHFREMEPEEREYLGRDSVIPVQGSAAGQAIREGRPVVTRDLKSENRFYEDSFLIRAGIRSRICIPLFVQGRPVGTLNLASDLPAAFSSGDIEFLSQISEQVSVAVANSLAYRQISSMKDRLERENTQLLEAIARSPQTHELIGESPGWKRVLEQIEMVAPTHSTVLIRGETGTGKELVARAIHRLSHRRERPFVAVNCAALSSELIASELFGYEKGAFTGAVSRKLGRVELAHGGTLFLDEIGDLPAEIQVKLLRFLQEREFERVGGNETLRTDVRVIAATNRDLEKLRGEGRFRDDFYFRVNVFPIVVPPLRERKEDVEPLMVYFLRKYSQKVDKEYHHIDRQSVLRCLDYSWPGNVRELENLVERTVILCPEPVFSMNPQAQAESAPSGGPQTSLKALVRAHIIRALKQCRGKIYGKDGAAQLLGLKPSTLQARIKTMGIDRLSFAPKS